MTVCLMTGEAVTAGVIGLHPEMALTAGVAAPPGTTVALCGVMTIGVREGMMIVGSGGMTDVVETAGVIVHRVMIVLMIGGSEVLLGKSVGP